MEIIKVIRNLCLGFLGGAFVGYFIVAPILQLLGL